MALGGIYETGTVTIGGDRVSVTGAGTLWTPTVEVGDWLMIGGQVGLIGAIVDDTHLTLEAQWQGTIPSAAIYVIIKMSWLRYDPALTQAKLRQLLEQLDAQGFFFFTPVAPPDPALGEDGQWALKTDEQPWRIWHKEGGVWVEQPPNTASMPQGTAGFHFEANGIGTASSFKGFTQAGTGAIARGWQSKVRESVSVKDFGAVGNGSTNDSAAFTAALTASSAVFVPPGSYNIGNVVMPANHLLFGCGEGITILVALSACVSVVKLGAGCILRDMAINGGNNAQHCVEIAGDYCRAENVHAQFAQHGFYNVSNDTWNLVGTSSDSCTYSIYSANRGINVTIDRHFSRGNDTYGYYATYTDQEPQGVKFISCGFFGNTNAIWFDKKAFFVNFVDSFIDACTGIGFRLPQLTAMDTSVDFYIARNFIHATGVPILIGGGNDHVVIESNTIAGGATRNLWVSSSATIYSRNVIIRGNNFGAPGNGDILVDSVQQCVIADNVFGQAGSGFAIEVGATRAGSAKVKVDNNMFQRVNPLQGSSMMICSGNIGFVTENQGIGTMPSGAATVSVNHGMNITPTEVWVTQTGLFGGACVQGMTPTKFDVIFGSAVPANWPFMWKAEALKA